MATTKHPEMDEAMDDVHEETAVLGQVAAAQARASDPRVSAWVSANAGSGKTHVLSQRVIRLLLHGTRPSAILCLTYTKAAAAEMSNRVFSRLAEWTRLDDATLSARIAEIEGRTPSPGLLLTARQLFARALETPGGLKIQTIHAFCEALLHRFPLEANVAGHFEILDDASAGALLAEARRTLLTAAMLEESAGLADAFARVLEAGGDAGLETLLAAIVGQRSDIRAFRRWSAGRGGTDAVLRHALGLADDDDEDRILQDVWPLPGLDLETYCAVVDEKGGVNAARFAAALRAAENAATARARWSSLTDAFLKGDGAPRSLSGAVPKAVANAMPQASDMMAAASAHVASTADRLARLHAFEATRAALTLAERLDRDYERLKRERGRLDFDDLVTRTAALLERSGAGAWVHYKLDQGIDHILVDEAQDTSPAQWSVIRALSDDFFAGAGARDTLRTLFAVGDEKQSIYSFQGARPERFDAERRSVERLARHADHRFEPVRLQVSFRSTADVLSAVDRVFEEPDTRRGVARDEPVVHETVRRRHPGSVDVWDMIHKDPAPDTDDWTAPFDALPERAPPARLAKRIAAVLDDWIGRLVIADKAGVRTVRPGDILILVRKRDAFVGALTRELKQRVAIPVAGADRLKLADHIAVKDLAALGRVALLPEDDLSLCAVLKSPLFDVSEDQLFSLAAGRGGDESVFHRLEALATAGETPWKAVHDTLMRHMAEAGRLPVFEFYARLLAEHGGRRRFLARLGSEASDVLDEFLAFAMDHEAAGGLPGLQSFLAAMETDSPEIKREMEKGRDEVRIMTVHAAKGLEAPVVFLVDSGGDAVHASHVPALRRLPLDPGDATAPPAPLWIPGKTYENTVSTALKAGVREAGEEEYRRLLYVAMTRAADRLVVCGYQNPDEPKYNFWQKMVRDALPPEIEGVEERTYRYAQMEWPGRRYAVSPAASPAPDVADGETDDRGSALPSDLVRPLPVSPRLPRPLSPSGASAVIDGDAPERPAASPLFGASGGAAGQPDALERGRIVHRFLQVLPGLPAGEREKAAERYLDRACAAWPAAERTAIYGSVARILDDPAFAPVFAPGSRAEVSVMGTLRIGARDRAVSGRIDRLAVDDDRVLIVDFKTNRPPVLSAEDVPEAYRAQLAIYRAVLAPLYPGRRIEAALVFTEAPVLIRLDDATLDAALAAVTPK